ncbi:MAG: hypothetical protein RIQ93_671 [Verrucomicrobiota bacterium]|jgi:endonuclease YncB( thermonuclease family)
MHDRALFPTPETFPALVAAVRAALIKGQARADRAYLESYRIIGFAIEAHLLFFKERAGYGEKVVPQLAGAIGVGERLLYRCLRLVREYPILTARSELGWSHYRVLLEVPDTTQRKALEVAAAKNHWVTAELERRVRALNAIDVTPGRPTGNGARRAAHKPLVPQRGATGVYRVATVEGKRVVDLGFAHYFDLSEDQAEEFKDGDLVQVDPAKRFGAGAGRFIRAEGARKTDLFNYGVELIRAVDGDTLWVRIYLGPRQWVKQKLRLRGLDCPELKTPAGKAAKRFGDALFAQTTAITINTTKPDKYDRYLADVFLGVEGGEAIFLNNALLENGHAARKDAWKFGDWEPELVG